MKRTQVFPDPDEESVGLYNEEERGEREEENMKEAEKTEEEEETKDVEMGNASFTERTRSSNSTNSLSSNLTYCTNPLTLEFYKPSDKESYASSDFLIDAKVMYIR